MEIQKTYEGSFAESHAIQFIQDLSQCFKIKMATITKMKQRYDWKGDKYQVKIKYE